MCRVVLLVSSLFLVACGTVDPPPGGTGESTSMDSVGASETGSATSQQTVGDDESGECDSCFVDFPCDGSEDRCLDETTLETHVTVPCEQTQQCAGACYCSGASCEPIEPTVCESDELCVQSNSPEGVSPSTTGSCASVEGLCGGPDGLTCDDGEFCDYVGGLCPECLGDPAGCGPGSPVARCRERPAAEFECPELGDNGLPLTPQCGCDGVTYLSECHRIQAGAALDHVFDCMP